MKLTKQFAAIALAPLAMLASCDESMFSGDQTSAGTGTILPTVNYDATVLGAPGTRAVTEFTDITVNDLTLTLTNTDKGETQTYAYADFPTDKGFAVGKYKLVASYGDPEEEGFEKPAVYGEAEFTVNEGKSTYVSLTAAPSKAMVGVQFDSSALNYFTELKASLHSVGGQTLEYATSESRYAYLKAGEVTLDVTFTKPNGQGATMEVAKFNTVAQHRYTVGVKLGGGDGTGSGVGDVETITITFDETLEKEDVTVDISDEVINAPAPEVVLSGATAGETISMIVASSLAEPVRFDIKARAGIKSAVLTTTGNSAGLPAGWPAEIDLVSATAEQQQNLVNLGFKNIGVFGKDEAAHLAAFELTDVINKHLPATAQAADPVTFALKVTDKNGKVASEEPVSFNVKIDNIELTMSTIDDEVYSGQESVKVLADFNGTDLESILSVSYLAATGMYKATTISKIEQQADDNKKYVVSIVVPTDAKLPVSLRVNALNLPAVDLVIPTAPTVTVIENDVFAKSAWVAVTGHGYDVASGVISVEVSTDGNSYTEAQGTQEGSEFHLTDLTPGTAYYVRAKFGNLVSAPVSMTTETAAQIPGSDMESWTAQSKHLSTLWLDCTWDYNDPREPWYGSNNTSFSKATYQSYRSGTDAVGKTEGINSSSTAAYIRTTGAATKSTDTTAGDGVWAGELWLGENKSGYELTSRPSAISFWYKYTAFNEGDKGLVEFTLMCGTKEIGKFTQELNATDSFTKITTPTYAYDRGSDKNVTISARFCSSATNDYLNKNGVNNLSSAGIMAGSRSDEFIGSVLVVDDIELVY